MLDYLDECRALVLEEIDRLIPDRPELQAPLYRLVREYPLRAAKALRPALCIATCRAAGGSLEGVLPTAAVLELYHNAFLVHDDVEDGSLTRRGEPTLHRSHGMPIAINVGDAMLALTLKPLLDNTATIGLGKALRVLEAVQEMAMQTVEGQAIELDWIRRGVWELGDDDYLRMVEKKTTWYSFLAPVRLGGIVGGVAPEVSEALEVFALSVGGAFQIHDDVLNLVGDEGRVGKETCGDLWEGKRTMVLLHALRSAGDRDRASAIAALARARPGPHVGPQVPTKTEGDVTMLRELIERHRSIAHARSVATRLAEGARDSLATVTTRLGDSAHMGFLRGVVDFVIDRDR